jgi:hypothetical protein
MDKARLQDEAELREPFLLELLALEKSGAALPLTLKPSEAWYLLASLQLVLRHTGFDGEIRAYIDGLAHNIESRLCKGRPAMAAVAAMGWQAEYDVSGRAGEPPLVAPARSYDPETFTKDMPFHGEEQRIEPGVIQQTEKGKVPEPEKRKPERTPDNKQLDVPENKQAGKHKRK